MSLVKLLVDHYDKEGRYIYAGTIVTVASKDLSQWMVSADASTKIEMDAKFKLDGSGTQYKRGTL